MTALAAIVRAISAMNAALGRIFASLALAIVAVCFAVVVLRYAFSIGFIWLQDLYVWMNGIMFTGIAGYVLLTDGHVRVDIFYRRASPRGKAWRDLAGVVVFLFPYCAVVTIWSWNYVMRSWQFSESSGNIGGMPGLFVVKSFILVFVAVVALQGIAMLLRSILVLTGRDDLLPDALRYREGT